MMQSTQQKYSQDFKKNQRDFYDFIAYKVYVLD